MAALHLAQTERRAAERDVAKGGEVQSEADRVALAQAEQAVEDSREVVRLVKAEADASRLHETIVRYTEIARALGPEGVRSRMLADGLKKLNAGLRAIASESGWPVTKVGDNGSITIQDRGWTMPRVVAMSSESERWRVQAALQLTLGAITGSKVVVLDRGDLLGRHQPARAGAGDGAGGRQDGHERPAVQHSRRQRTARPVAAGSNPERQDCMTMNLSGRIEELEAQNAEMLRALELIVKEDGTPAQKGLRRANALHVIAKAKGDGNESI